MPHYLQRCRDCEHFIPSGRLLCPACARLVRLAAEPPRRAGWTYFSARECAWLLALLGALVLALEFRLQIGSMEQWPYWYCPPGEVGRVVWQDVARVAASVGLPGGILFGFALLGTVLLTEREHGCWLPDAWLPLSGRWLKYFLVALLVGTAVLLQLPLASWGWFTIPGLWLCLLAGARVYTAKGWI